MDKVQIYCTVMVSWSVFNHAHQLLEKKEKGQVFISLLASAANLAPLVGRIYGWW